MSRHECIKMFEFIMRMLFLIYWRQVGFSIDTKKLHTQLKDEYNEFMTNIEFSRNG